jgi:hypothetical protein
LHRREWPSLLAANLLSVIAFPDFQAYLLFSVESVVEVSKEMVQKSLLPIEGLLAIKCLPLLSPMSEQPLLPGRYGSAVQQQIAGDELRFSISGAPSRAGTAARLHMPVKGFNPGNVLWRRRRQSVSA